MASSESAAREAQQKGRVCSERIRVVHNGVETPRHISEIDLSRLRSELEVPANAAVISVVARLRPEKGIDVLIDAIPRVERLVQRPVALVVVGDGTEAGHLRTKASRSDAGQILFVGAKSDVSPWFRVADVVAVPSLFEPFGLSALEAVACQRPIVASSVGGLPEFISHGKTGILVPPGDSGALSEALADMLIDQKRAENMATAGYRLYCERFTTDAMVEKWLECYGEMLRQGVAH
jgi:glycosyltransferase involved in cell wall biosynthesis